MGTVLVTGRVHDGDGRGVPRVAVSDGVSVTTTDVDGHYRLRLDPERRHTSLVQITVPAGWQAPCDESRLPGFFRPVSGSNAGVVGGPWKTTVDFELAADPASAEPDSQFIALTDVHVPVDTDYPVFARVTGMVPEARFVIVSGDLTNDATPAEFDAYRAATANSAVPVWPAPGNHDLVRQGRGGPQPRQTAKPPYRDAVEGYRRVLGPEWYSFQYGAHHFVVLENYRGLPEADQFAWLERDLALAGDRPVVVVTHVPWNVPQTPRRSVIAPYLELLGRYDVRLLVAGHTHSNEVAAGIVGKARQVVTTAPTSATLDHSPPGFRVVELRGSASEARGQSRGVASGTGELGQEVAGGTEGPSRDGEIQARFVELDPAVRGTPPAPAPGAPPPVPGRAWPMFHGDARHSGVSADSVTPPLRLAWVHRCGGTILTSSPAVAGDRLFIGVRDEDGADGNGVLGLDLVTGQRRWWAPAPSPVAASPAVAGAAATGLDDDLVLVPAARGPLRALAAGSGEAVWEWRPEPAAAPCWMYFSPTIVDGTVYQAYSVARGTWVVALDAATGQPRWHTQEPIGRNWVSHAAPAVDGDWLVFATAYANLVALEASCGAVRWQRVLGGGLKVGAAPVVVDGLVLLARHGDVLVAADLATGEERWHYQAAGEPLRPVPDTTATPAVWDGTAYAGFIDGTAVAVDLATGEPQWRQRTQGAVLSSPAVSGPLLYVGSHDGWLRALDRATGEPQWIFELRAPVTSSPAITGNAVVVATWSGAVHAFTAD